MTDTSSLFRPFSCKGLTLANRIVMAPMTREKSPGGIPGRDVAEYYARRAAADIGLIITEGTTVDRAAASNSNEVPNIHSGDALEGWRKVVTNVHVEGGKIAPQLWHQGMARKPGTGPHPEAPSDGPSGITHTGKQVLPEPTDSDVADMIASFARAGKNAKNLGFDAIEIHGAHGYLVDQFFWEGMNIRTDKYGGSVINRASFGADIVKAIRREVGSDMPIILRFSQWKQQNYEAKLAQTPTELEKFLSVFVDSGLDIFHCSTRRFWEPEFKGSDLNLAGWTKKLTGRPTITVGSVGLSSDFIGSLVHQTTSEKQSLDNLLERLEREEFDLVGVGRALLQDPNWAVKVKDGRMDELQDYDPAARTTLY
ncbi:MAG: NADH:flavin oxidoreductase [Hellea sp.]|nr:NADH:flavin oxidoreductase [Hellea sp.]